MGRSNGYRPRKDVRDEVLELRARLHKLRDDDWAKAGVIMGEIAALLGHNYGPMGGKIEPRACKYCRYYGHTRQWCKVLKADREAAEQRAIEAMLKEDERLQESVAHIPEVREPYDPTKTGQALTFDRLGIPYSVDPDCGPIVGAPGGVHRGKWTFKMTTQSDAPNDHDVIVVER